MATITISAAARMMRWRSRSTIYRLRDAGALKGYIRQAANGSTVLEMHPPNRPPLDEHLREVVRTQVNSPGRPKQQQAVDPVEVAQREAERLRQQLAAARAREAQWVADYEPVREWIADGFTMELWRALGDEPLQIGAVMTTARSLLLNRLTALDACERASRWPR